jgi:hypothetical protein
MKDEAENLRFEIETFRFEIETFKLEISNLRFEISDRFHPCGPGFFFLVVLRCAGVLVRSGLPGLLVA